ncbi:MAG: septum site-determining protein MinC [Bacillota bacterium]
MSENAIVFKGTKEGLYVVLKEEMDIESIKENLEKKVKPSKKFFEGASIVDFRGKKLTRLEYEELKSILLNDYGMNVLGEYREFIDEQLQDKDEAKEPTSFYKLPYENMSSDDALFIRATVRSGQLIDYKGNIVIVGDVNPGAYIRATGSIVVMGSLRGVAHGGAKGNYGAFIAAFNLQPTQLRIGDIITRAPDGYAKKHIIPEMAVVKRGSIIVEPYLPNK